MNKANDLLKKEIYNPYRINWLMYSIIGTASTILMVVAVIWNYYTNNIISEILKNLGFGCVASTIVALFIEIGNVKDKNENANKVYDAVYVDLKYQIMRYIEIWSELLIISRQGIRIGTLFRSIDFLLRTTGSQLRST